MTPDHQTTPVAGLLRRRLSTASQSGTVWLVIGIAVLAIWIALGGEKARLLLRYERVAILQQHEYWRLLTCHLVHADWHHLWLNLAGLALIASLGRRCYAFGEWLIVVSSVLVVMAAGFLLCMPQLAWYVGLSGALHGVLAAAAVRWWRIESPWLAALLSLILLGKLGWEQWQGALPLSGELTVIVNAHLYGAVGGLLAGLWLDLRQRRLSGSPAVT